MKKRFILLCMMTAVMSCDKLEPASDSTPNILTKQTHSFSKWVVVTDSITVSTTEEDIVPHLIPTVWGQCSPWNTKLPYDTKYDSRCYLGCAPVAISQLLYYTHFHIGVPDMLYHDVSITKANINGSTTDIGYKASSPTLHSTRWDEMALSNYSGGNTGYVQDLMLEVGHALGTVYSGNGSGAAPSVRAINSLGLSCNEDNYSYATVRKCLISGMPVIISAYATKKKTGVWPFNGTSYSDGHCWIVDGIHRVTRTDTHIAHCEYTDTWDGNAETFDSFEEIQEKYGIDGSEKSFTFAGSETSTEYLLMNWGFSGIFDDIPYETSSEAAWHANGLDYQYEKKILYNFR